MASESVTVDGGSAGKTPEWAWHPPLPLENSPVFAWPPRPAEALKWLARSWYGLTERVILVLLAFAVWRYLQPALERCVDFEFGWIAQIYARNLALMVLVAGGLHLYFYTFRKQGSERKFDPRDLAGKRRGFTGGNQVRDNMIWTCASGVSFWTAYEVLFMWSYANGYLPMLEFAANPVWFVLLFALIPIWEALHFYWVHRLLHWRPLYKVAHALHHRNVNTGPWSGLSMHPIEHAIYMSSVLIHWLVASHPVHVFFHMYYLTLSAATSHTGFEGLLVRGRSRYALGLFYHQLHHRYFECNYGNAEMPWDKWFGSFHDGTPEATLRMRERRRRMHGTA